jgi:hypothetical protein
MQMIAETTTYDARAIADEIKHQTRCGDLYNIRPDYEGYLATRFTADIQPSLGMNVVAFTIDPQQDKPVFGKAVQATLDLAYSIRGVEYGTFDAFNPESENRSVHFASISRRRGKYKPYMSGTMTLQYGETAEGKGTTTEMADLFIWNDGRDRLPTALADINSTFNPPHVLIGAQEGDRGLNYRDVAEIKRFGVIKPDGHVAMGLDNAAGFPGMIYLAAATAMSENVKYMTAVMPRELVRRLKSMQLPFKEIENYNLDWLKPGNLDYFWQYRKYFLNTKLVESAEFGGRDGLAAIVNEAQNAQTTVERNALLKKLHHISRPRAYYTPTEVLANESARLLREWPMMVESEIQSRIPVTLPKSLLKIASRVIASILPI